MATINEQFIQVKTKANFESRLSAGDVKDTSIAFIEDTNEIWAKGHYYPCPYSATEITNLLNNKVDKESGKSLVADELITKLTGLDDQNTIDAAINVVQGNLTTHINDKDNPHEVTKALIGLSNVDNTSDANKPVSIAQQAAIDAAEKVATDHIANKENPHEVTKEQIGLGNVTNDTQVKRTEMGVANGVATLNESGQVPSSLLPSIDLASLDDKYVSVNNIKTINGESIIGTGDITISTESGIEDAPSDGKQYVRQNGAWVEVSFDTTELLNRIEALEQALT